MNPKNTPIGSAKGHVTFEHVRFGYSPIRLLSMTLQLKLSQDREVAIVGPTGAGKTTMVNLLMRFTTFKLVKLPSMVWILRP